MFQQQNFLSSGPKIKKNLFEIQYAPPCPVLFSSFTSPITTSPQINHLWSFFPRISVFFSNFFVRLTPSSPSHRDHHPAGCCLARQGGGRGFSSSAAAAVASAAVSPRLPPAGCCWLFGCCCGESMPSAFPPFSLYFWNQKYSFKLLKEEGERETQRWLIFFIGLELFSWWVLPFTGNFVLPSCSWWWFQGRSTLYLYGGKHRAQGV